MLDLATRKPPVNGLDLTHIAERRGCSNRLQSNQRVIEEQQGIRCEHCTTPFGSQKGLNGAERKRVLQRAVDDRALTVL